MQKVSKLTLSALLLVLTYISTFLIQIPIPITNGYIHPGDTFIILSAIFLGPLYGSIVAGLGSMLADITSGYIFYAPITFIIKASSAFIMGYFFHKVQCFNKFSKVFIIGCIHCVFIVLGYGLFEAILFSIPIALIAAPLTLVQGLISLIIATILYPTFDRFPCIKKHLSE